MYATPRSVLRALIAAGVLLAVYGASASAWASVPAAAPYCDDRGASALAIPPALEAPDVAIQRMRLSDYSFRSQSWIFGVISPAPQTWRSIVDGADSALPTPPAVPTLRVLVAILDRPAATLRGWAGGVRFRVERPPR